jgi:hypothetical protein
MLFNDENQIYCFGLRCNLLRSKKRLGNLILEFSVILISKIPEILEVFVSTIM